MLEASWWLKFGQNISIELLSPSVNFRPAEKQKIRKKLLKTFRERKFSRKGVKARELLTSTLLILHKHQNTEQSGISKGAPEVAVSYFSNQQEIIWEMPRTAS